MMSHFLTGFFIGSIPGFLLLDFITPADLGPSGSIVIIVGVAITLFGVFRSRSLGGFVSGMVVGLGVGILLLGFI